LKDASPKVWAPKGKKSETDGICLGEWEGIDEGMQISFGERRKEIQGERGSEKSMLDSSLNLLGEKTWDVTVETPNKKKLLIE